MAPASPGTLEAALAAPTARPSATLAAQLDVPVIVDPMPQASAPAARPQPSIKAAKPIVVAIVPKTTHAISGVASWYCRAGVSPCTFAYPDDGGIDAYAAAGPRLRAAMGSSWRGAIVYVNGLRVQLIDWCQCYQGEPHEKLLDLYYDVYARTGSSVTVRW